MKKNAGHRKALPGLCSSALWNSNGNVWVTDEAAPKITSLISGQNRGLSLPLWLTQHTECPAAPEHFALLAFLIPFLFKVVKFFSFNQANSLEAGGKLCLPRRKILFWGSWFYHVTITPLLSRLFFLLNMHAHHMPNDLQFKKIPTKLFVLPGSTLLRCTFKRRCSEEGSWLHQADWGPEGWDISSPKRQS